MERLQQYLDQIDQLLKELIEVSTQLRDTSKQIISEEELAPLQRRQEQLLKQIAHIDQKLQERYSSEIDAGLHHQWHQQLETFRELNEEFINNLNSASGLIQFDEHSSKEKRSREDNLDLAEILSRLNKAPSASSKSNKIKKIKDSK